MGDIIVVFLNSRKNDNLNRNYNFEEKFVDSNCTVLNEEENVEFFYDEFIKNKGYFDEHDIDYELIYVDDGSSDFTAERVRTLAQ